MVKTVLPFYILHFTIWNQTGDYHSSLACFYDKDQTLLFIYIPLKSPFYQLNFFFGISSICHFPDGQHSWSSATWIRSMIFPVKCCLFQKWSRSEPISFPRCCMTIWNANLLPRKPFRGSISILWVMRCWDQCSIMIVGWCILSNSLTLLIWSFILKRLLTLPEKE